MPRRVSNPPNPWETIHAEWLGEPPPAELEVFEEEAKSIITENDSPDVGFRFGVNPYRGCFHSCSYCTLGETPILMADGRTKPLEDVRVGDEIYGTVHFWRYRRYVKTKVLAHWSTVKPAWRLVLEDGTELVTSADHRFLTRRGWTHVGPNPAGRQWPHLTVTNELLGTGKFATAPSETAEYRRGYLCGVVRGDALLRSYSYSGRRRGVDKQHQFRLAMVDIEPLLRTRRYLDELAVETREFVFQAAAATRRQMHAIRTHARSSVERIRSAVEWPAEPAPDWRKGFLAGIFDAEGCYSGGILRISNTDEAIIEAITDCLAYLGFDYVVETQLREKPVLNVRIRGGLREHLRFFHTVDPAITRKRNIAGQSIKNRSPLRVVSVEPLGVDLPMYDITTGTGDFIANGVVSHNCYARPTHQYLGWGAGTDFDRKIVAKVNAPMLLRQEMSRKSWKGDTIVFSGITDCYQPIEATYALTRRCLEICAEFRNPVGIVTKGALIRRDVDLLARLAEEADVGVWISTPFLDDATGRAIEPGASLPSQRFETMRILARAGIRVGVAVAPVIPGLNDSHIAGILERARDAGARHAFLQPVRLPAEVLPVFEERLAQAFPQRAKKVWSAIEQIRGGRRNDSRFGMRMTGQGPRWAAIRTLFGVECRRLGLNAEDPERHHRTTFRRPSAQGNLFGD